MPETPPDPFTAMHTGYVTLLETFRGFRKAGGGWVESAILVAAQVVVYGHVAQDNGDGE